MKREVKVGDVFGYLEVIELNNSHARGKSWLCKCVCGKELVLNTSGLIGSGKTLGKGKKSCGCKQFLRDRLVIENKRLYSIWYAMKRRCYDPKNGSYDRYGAKGIKVSDVWKEDFEVFCEWALTNGYEEHLTIDRVDPTKDYGPDNCRWATYLKQMQGRGIHKDNKTGVQGAFLGKSGRYNLTLTRDFKRYNLGMYDTVEECANARSKALLYYEKNGTLEGYEPKWKRLRNTSH